MDKVILNGKSYDLPKKTLAVVEKIEEIKEAEKSYLKGNYKIRDLIMLQYNFLVNMIGVENVEILLDGNVIDDMNVNDIIVAILNISHTYNKPIEDAKYKNISEQLNRAEFRKVETLTKGLK